MIKLVRWKVFTIYLKLHPETKIHTLSHSHTDVRSLEFRAAQTMCKRSAAENCKEKQQTIDSEPPILHRSAPGKKPNFDKT